jgi:hypothetical protein
MNARKINIYNHVMPRAVADLMLELAPSVSGMIERVTRIPMLHDMDARIRMMEMWPGYQQVLTVSNPPLEAIAGPGDTPRLARLANDELKRICDTRPDKFPAWVASLPLNNVEATLDEMDRAMAQGARGFQVFTNVNGIPLDDPSLLPVFDRATNEQFIHLVRQRQRFVESLVEGRIEIRKQRVAGDAVEQLGAQCRQRVDLDLLASPLLPPCWRTLVARLDRGKGDFRSTHVALGNAR